MNQSFLTFGCTHSGKWVNIQDVASGKHKLYCPYCKQPLIAKKGRAKVHHFAHQDETCHDVESAIVHTQIPTIDRFELLDLDEIKYLERRGKYKHSDIYYWRGLNDAVTRLEKMEILTVNRKDDQNNEALVRAVKDLSQLKAGYIDVDGNPSPKLTAVLKALTPLANVESIWNEAAYQLVTETKISRRYHQNKLDKQRTVAQLADVQRYWLDTFYRRQCFSYPEYVELLTQKLQGINAQMLYLFSFKADIKDCPEHFIKIGMTTRPIDERLQEVKAMLSQYGKIIDAQTLAVLPTLGRIEKLLHSQYANEKIDLAQHREFFNYELVETLLTQFDEITNLEPYIPPAVENRPVLEMPSPGRKKKAGAQLIAEYPEIVEHLNQGSGIRQISRLTGRSVNTIQKVKAAIQEV